MRLTRKQGAWTPARSAAKVAPQYLEVSLEAATPNLGPIEKARPGMRTGGHCEGALVAPSAARHTPSLRALPAVCSSARLFLAGFRKPAPKGLGKHSTHLGTQDLGHREGGTGFLREVALGEKTTGGHRAVLRGGLTTLSRPGRVATPEACSDFPYCVPHPRCRVQRLSAHPRILNPHPAPLQPEPAFVLC